MNHVENQADTFGALVDRAVRQWRHPSWWTLLVLSPWMIGTALSIRDWRVKLDAGVHQETVKGTIIGHEPRNHDSYSYEFLVHGRTFKGSDSPLDYEPTLGQEVTVYFDSRDPSSNALTEFSRLAVRDLGPVPLMVLGTGLLVLFIAVRRRRIAPRAL